MERELNNWDSPAYEDGSGWPWKLYEIVWSPRKEVGLWYMFMELWPSWHALVWCEQKNTRVNWSIARGLVSILDGHSCCSVYRRGCKCMQCRTTSGYTLHYLNLTWKWKLCNKTYLLLKTSFSLHPLGFMLNLWDAMASTAYTCRYSTHSMCLNQIELPSLLVQWMSCGALGRFCQGCRGYPMIKNNVFLSGNLLHTRWICHNLPHSECGGLSVFIPLANVDLDRGPQEVLPGTHSLHDA